MSASLVGSEMCIRDREVVDAPKSAKLPSHVGERVSVTGVLNGREMQVRSLQRLSPSCSVKG